jgi:hypothetical protein
MKTAIIASLLGAGAVCAPQLAAAASIDQYSHDQVGWTYARRPPAARPLRPLWTMDLRPRKPLERPYAEVSGTQAEDHLPTSVSYQIAPNGPVGAVGLVDFSSSHAVDPIYLSNAVANQPGAPSQTVGVSLAYAFK